MAQASWLKLGGCLALLGVCLGCDAGTKTTVDDTAGASSGGSASSSAGSSTTNGGSSIAQGGSSGSSAGGSGGSPPSPTDSLAQKYADYFPIGVALGSIHLSTMGDIVERDFNHLTCENAMKIQDIHPAEATFAWEEADYIADYARQRGWKLTGHALLWHRQAPEWMFAGVTAGDATSLETLKSRLKAHIEAMVERYGDVVDNWDVVNEAISDDAAKTYRDGPEGSKWFELFGSEEYIYWAFKYGPRGEVGRPGPDGPPGPAGPTGPIGISGYQLLVTSGHTVPGGGIGTDGRYCTGGRRVLGGGVSTTSLYETRVTQSAALDGGAGWSGTIVNESTSPKVMYVWAICAHVS